MRCRNCGYENDLGNSRCIMCDAPLNGPIVDDDRSVNDDYGYNNMKGTVRENDHVFINKTDDGIGNCSRCNYPYNLEMGACPNCGYDANNTGANKVKPFKMGTVNPWAQPQYVDEMANCTLTPIAWDNERLDSVDIQFTGDTVVLNRDNTDPNNSSITSKTQAVLSYEDGAWYVEDKSQMQTTFKHISKKTLLEDGDVLLLGNRRFIFNKK